MARSGRSGNRELAAAALATGATVDDAATAAKVSRRTLETWKADPAFASRVTELRSEAVDRALNTLSDAMTEAADTLRGLLSASSQYVRLGAARAIIELGINLVELQELKRQAAEQERRIEELEERMNGSPADVYAGALPWAGGDTEPAAI